MYFKNTVSPLKEVQEVVIYCKVSYTATLLFSSIYWPQWNTPCVPSGFESGELVQLQMLSLYSRCFATWWKANWKWQVLSTTGPKVQALQGHISIKHVYDLDGLEQQLLLRLMMQWEVLPYKWTASNSCLNHVLYVCKVQWCVLCGHLAVTKELVNFILSTLERNPHGDDMNYDSSNLCLYLTFMYI